MIVRKSMLLGRPMSLSSCTWHRHCASSPSPLRRGVQTASQDLQITDPVVAYQAMVAKGKVESDPEQIRALVELRKLSRALQDYTPPAHLLGVLQDASGRQQNQQQQHLSVDPLTGRGAELVAPASDENISALVQYLSEEQQLEQLGTPRGLLLTGKPGTGKSFLVDLWFDCLPVRGKFRRHYHHLLLSIYRLIWVEAERRRVTLGTSQFFERQNTLPDRGVGAIWERVDSGDRKGSTTKSLGDWARSLKGMPFLRADRKAPAPVMSFDGAGLDDEANKGMDVVKLAQMERQEDKMAGLGTTLPMHVASQLFLTYGHVLVFDELQLLDIASATLLRRILTSYWRLGGVVVATSNRVPEDLYENNVQRRSLVAFLAALKERCPIVEVQGRDWRVERWKQGWDKFASLGDKEQDMDSTFFIKGQEKDDRAFETVVAQVVGEREGISGTIQVYNRTVVVPISYAATEGLPSVAAYTFTQLCDTPLGPADYLTLASMYTVIILDDIPALDLVHRNQARRFITLIDALYEAKCRVILRSRVPLTKIFFAREGAEVAEENERRQGGGKAETARDVQDFLQTSGLIQSETLSEAMQDTEEGFRPNISAYGPIVETPGRMEPGRESQRQEEERKSGKKTSLSALSIFSGQEEQFSYQRAVSRLWEMSHSSWSQSTQWKPLLQIDLEAWTSSSEKDTFQPKKPMTAASTFRDSQISLSSESADNDFSDEASYSGAGEEERRRSQRRKGPPVLSSAHVWGVRDDWGPNAGKWGKGVGGLQSAEDESEAPRERRQRLKEQRRSQSSSSSSSPSASSS